MSDSNPGGNFMPKEELAASGSGHLLLTDFGDDENPYTETVEFLDDLVLEFITDFTKKAMEIGRSGRVQVEDVIFLARKQPKMYARTRDLLTMNEELKKARKAFDEVKYVQDQK